MADTVFQKATQRKAGGETERENQTPQEGRLNCLGGKPSMVTTHCPAQGKRLVGPEAGMITRELRDVLSSDSHEVQERWL